MKASKTKNQNRIKIRELARTTKKIFSGSLGILFIYILIFSAFMEYLYFPAIRKLWSLSLMTVEEGYISESNFVSIFTHPLVLIVGLFIVASYCVLTLWQSAGLIMILEYAYNDKPVKFFYIFPQSFKQILNCLKPKNWMLFVYMLIIQPLIDADFAGQMLSRVTVPEYIMDYMLNRVWLALVYMVVIIVALVFFIRFLFVPMSMILEKKTFIAASKKSASFLRKRFVSTYIKVALAALAGTAIFRIVPFIIMYLLEFGLLIGFSGHDFAVSISDIVFDDEASAVLQELSSIFIKIFITAILVVLYHRFEAELGAEPEMTLPEECVKTKGKIFKFKAFVPGIYGLVYVVATVLFIMVTTISDVDPAAMAMFVNSSEVVAHKGYSSAAPENTMEAFERAANVEEVDWIELDVRETSDGVPVVTHNETIEEATGENVSIYDISYDDLQRLNAHYGFEEDEFPEARIPSLDEVLGKYFDKKNFIIEIKMDKRTPMLPAKIVELMEKYGITESSVIHSGSYEALRLAKEANPDVSCGFIVAVSTGGYEDLPYADFFSVEHTFLSETTIENIHKRGKKIYVWTVNDSESFEKLQQVEVDGVITDYPERAYEEIHQFDRGVREKLREKFGRVGRKEDYLNGTLTYDGEGD